MKLHDALFNWLQMDIVVRNRPNDNAAVQTLDFFAQILHEDHSLTRVEAELIDENTYTITYEREGQINQAEFDRLLCEQLWHDIESNPKYNE